jgi:putative nucleotidyltransferase with HDIG domain
MTNTKKLPNEEECYRLMEQYEMLPNIKDHSILVKNVSMALTFNLKKSAHINPELVLAGALLHDIAKTRAVKLKEFGHDKIGAAMMRELGYNSIADIIESHVILKIFDVNGILDEREIVHYADKRVMHDKIVTLEERFVDLNNRYGIPLNVPHIIQNNKEFALLLENKIERFMKISIEKALINL